MALCLAGGAAAAVPPWRDAPEYLLLFAPAAQRSAYGAATVPAGIAEVLEALAEDASVVRTAGAWQARRQAALDAFGRSGTYDRWRLARLYGSREPLVARGARIENGRIAEAWTLISPYPDPQLTSLNAGTLLLRVRLP